jgi:hypothetical protein
MIVIEQRSLVPDGQRVVTEIAVTEVVPSRRQLDEDKE